MKTNMELLAKDIYNWCKAKDLWYDCCIYFNGVAWSSSPKWGMVSGKKIGEDLYEYANKNPKDYFEYAHPETLSMSFEGPLYHVLNGYTYGWTKLENEFNKIFEKYDCYYEFGHAWNLSACKI